MAACELELPCLSGFITPRVACGQAGYTKPKSGLNVEDLPGIGTASLAAVEPGKYLNAQTFIDEKMKVAGMMILDRMRDYLEPWVKERGVKEYGYIGTWTDPETSVAGSTSKRGVRVKVQGGPLLIPSIPKVYMKSATAVTDLVLYVKDGNEVSEFTVTLEAGVETEVWLNYEAKGKTVDIYVEDDEFEPFTASSQGTTHFSTCTSCGGHYRYVGISGTGLVDGVEGDTVYGIRPEVALLCSIDPVACVMLKRFRFAVLYQWGILVLEEWLASPRTNYFTIHSKEWAIGAIEQWNTVELPRYMKGPSEKLAHFVSNLDPDCLKCGSGAHYVTSHP